MLGHLELEVMEFMRQISKSSVRQVTKTIDCKRPITYTTVMTVMRHLVDNRLLTRTADGLKVEKVTNLAFEIFKLIEARS